MKVSGLSRTWSPNFILGYSDTETVKLDFDRTPFRLVKYWAERALKWFKLGGYVILKSSENNYHVVFDRAVTWAENLRIVAWVCLRSRHTKLTDWLLMQCIKGSSTLRLSPRERNRLPESSSVRVNNTGKPKGS